MVENTGYWLHEKRSVGSEESTENVKIRKKVLFLKKNLVSSKKSCTFAVRFVQTGVKLIINPDTWFV